MNNIISEQAVQILAATIAVSTGGHQPSEEALADIMKCYWNLIDRITRILQSD